MTLEQAITNWDGKSASDIKEIYQRHCGTDSFTASLIKSLAPGDLQIGASWLLKHYLENNNTLDSDQLSAIYQSLSALGHWQARLHILQCIPMMPIGKPETKTVEGFLRSCLADSNKFIRAWAYNGFFELAMQYPEYRPETRQFFDMALRDEAPSVKARIRNIMQSSAYQKAFED